MNRIKQYLTLSFFLFIIGIAGRGLAQEEVLIDGVAAVIGKNIVKISDIENAFLQVRISQGYENAFQNRCDILEGMLISRLLIHKGEVDSTEVTDEEVEAEAERYLKSYIRQYGSKEALQESTGYTYDELYEIYFTLIHDRILSQRVEYGLTQNVKITPAEVGEFFHRIPADSIPVVETEYEVSEILMKPNVTEVERDRVRTELAQLRERVLKGESFSMLATLYSQDPESAKKGGELGFFTRGDMVSAFESAAFTLKPGEVSPIVETQYGFHIIQLIERRGNAINARHILLSPQVSAEDLLRVRITLDSLANQIRLGNIPFDEAAKKYSMAESKAQGGLATNQYTGNNRFTQSTFNEQFRGISINAMQPGDVSNATLMTTDDNHQVYRLVRLNKKIDEHKANLTDDYDKIYNAALQEAKNNKLMDWAQKMIKNTHIRLSDEYQGCSFRLNWTEK